MEILNLVADCSTTVYSLIMVDLVNKEGKTAKTVVHHVRGTL